MKCPTFGGIVADFMEVAVAKGADPLDDVARMRISTTFAWRAGALRTFRPSAVTRRRFGVAAEIEAIFLAGMELFR